MLKTATRPGQDQGKLRRPSLLIGRSLLIIGIGSVIALVIVDRLSTFEISMAMLAAGALQISHALGARRRGWPLFTVLAALLYVVAALVILFQPLIEMRWVEFLLVGSLAMAGVSRLAIAARLDAALRGWEALSGLTTLTVAVIIGAGMPEMSLWPLGFAIALDLIVEGSALANIGWAIRTPPAR